MRNGRTVLRVQRHRVEEFPLPAGLPVEFGRELDTLAQQLAAATTSEEDNRLRTRMIALQEELDWDVYHRYGLITDDAGGGPDRSARLRSESELGQRAFEIVMARKMERGELETQWFARHRSTPITEIPKDWPEPYRQVVERRIEIIETNRNIGLIERPECKRRWQSDPWEEREARRLTTWLLDRCEERSLWFDPDGPRPMTVNRLADRLRTDPEVVAKAREFKGPDTDLADVLKEIIADEHVPFLAAYRYKPTGLAKRAQWERTWDLQREEDSDRQAPGHRCPPEVPGRRLPEAVLLAPPRQARRPQGTLHQLPRRQPRQRQGLPAARLGRLGPQGPGHRPDHPDRRPQHHRRLGHGPPNPAARRPPGANALAPPVAQRDDRPRPEPTPKPTTPT